MSLKSSGIARSANVVTSTLQHAVAATPDTVHSFSGSREEAP
jgi:hypothetical protein